MSCVALCIKLVTWIFGQRRPRRRLIRQIQEDNSSRVPAYTPLDNHHHHYHHHPNSNGAEERNEDVHDSDVELREVPFRNIEEPLESKEGFRSKRNSMATVSNAGGDDNGRNPTADRLTSGACLKEGEDNERVSSHEDGDDDDGDEE